MDARRTLIHVAGVALAAIATIAGPGAIVACGGDDNGGNPQPVDAGVTPASDANTGASPDAGGGAGSGDSGDGGPTTAADTGPACTPDGGSGAACNSCATVATDPYNACSSFTINCIPFDNARVPVHPAP